MKADNERLDHALGLFPAGTLADLHGPDADVFAFFSNDPKGCAVKDAQMFARLCEKHGLAPTRVPGEKVTLNTT